MKNDVRHLRNQSLHRRSEAMSWAQSEQGEERPADGDRKSISSEDQESSVTAGSVRTSSLFESLLVSDDRNEVSMIDDRRLCRLCMLAVIVSLFGEKAIMLM